LTTWAAPATVWNNQTVRDLERASIREFVASCAPLLIGNVLDYGCGKQPYRDIVEEAGGRYVGYDRADYPANVSGQNIGPDVLNVLDDFDAILCTQVAQYWTDPRHTLKLLRRILDLRGYLVITFPTNWDEVEPDDLFRYTATGMRYLLEHEAGFTVERVERRAEISLGGFRFPLGYGIVARA
jgi:SAM-dependent methyltransferase